MMCNVGVLDEFGLSSKKMGSYLRCGQLKMNDPYCMTP